MFKLFRYLGKREWAMAGCALLFILGQVWADLRLPEYMSEITVLVQTEGSAMGDILHAGGLMLLCALGSMVLAIATGFLNRRRLGVPHPQFAVRPLPQGPLLRQRRDGPLLHRLPHHPHHQRRHPGADGAVDGPPDAGQGTGHGGAGHPQNPGKRQPPVDPVNRLRRHPAAGGAGAPDGLCAAEV